jgi:hypothetical protein
VRRGGSGDGGECARDDFASIRGHLLTEPWFRPVPFTLYTCGRVQGVRYISWTLCSPFNSSYCIYLHARLRSHGRSRAVRHTRTHASNSPSTRRPTLSNQRSHKYKVSTHTHTHTRAHARAYLYIYTHKHTHTHAHQTFIQYFCVQSTFKAVF